MFINDYLHYATGNEAPEIFHKWAAISTLSSLMGRRVWVDQGYFLRYPNLYIIFVGDPANGKSTALSIARRLVKEFETICVAPSSITKERLTQLMADNDGPCHQAFKLPNNPDIQTYSQISIFSNELVTLLGKQSPLAMIELLTDIWDQDEFEVDTKNKGYDKIIGPYLTLLGCMTPEITNTLLKQNIISGGFSRRCIFVYRNALNKPIPRPLVTLEQVQARHRCLLWGKQLLEVKGKFSWTPETIEFFDAWYKLNHEKLNQRLDIVTKGYYRTKDELLLKITMLIQLAESRETVLTLSAMHKALDLLTDTESSLSKVFADTGKNHQAFIAAKIIRFLEETVRPLAEKQVYLELFTDGDRMEIERTLHHLIATDQIERVQKNDSIFLQLKPRNHRL